MKSASIRKGLLVLVVVLLLSLPGISFAAEAPPDPASIEGSIVLQSGETLDASEVDHLQVLTLLSTLDSHTMNSSPPVARLVRIASADEVQNPTISESPTLTQWQIYNDTDYGFTLEYPESWRAEITIDVRHPSPKPEWILRRYSFFGTEGALDLDIWAAQDMELSAWLEWMGEITTPFLITKPNAQVASYPAVAFVNDEMLTVFFSDGEHVYRLWYTAVHNEDGLKVFQHLLDTLQLSKHAGVGAHIPQSVVEDTRQLIKKTTGCGTNDNCAAVYYQGCCGHSSTFCSTYFPCSRENNVDKGNCTWYVCYKYGSVPFRGNASTWWSQVPTYSAWGRSTSPRMNSRNIAWWGANHVAYVPYYYGGTPTIHEMNWCLTCERQRPSYLSYGDGYIWKYSEPQPEFSTYSAR